MPSGWLVCTTPPEQLHCAAQSRLKAHSPECSSWQGIGPALPFSQPQGWVTCTFHQCQFHCVAQVRHKACSRCPPDYHRWWAVRAVSLYPQPLMADEWWGQRSLSLWADSPVPSPPGLALLYCPGWVQGSLCIWWGAGPAYPFLGPRCFLHWNFVLWCLCIKICVSSHLLNS